MENKKASVKKIALNFGLLLALATIGLSVVVYALGMHLDQPWWQSVLNIIFTLTAIVYGLKAYKSEGDGFLTISEALKTGVAITLVAAIIGSAYTYLFVTVIETDFISQYLEKIQENMIADQPQMTEEQLKMSMDITKKMMTPAIMTAMGLIVSLFFGFIISLLAGLVLKQNRPDNY